VYCKIAANQFASGLSYDDWKNMNRWSWDFQLKCSVLTTFFRHQPEMIGYTIFSGGVLIDARRSPSRQHQDIFVRIVLKKYMGFPMYETKPYG
jgi:hypothetical protein